MFDILACGFMSSTDFFRAVHRDLSVVLGGLLRLPFGRDDGNWLNTPPLLAVRKRRTAPGVVIMHAARYVVALSNILILQAVLKDVHAVSRLKMKIVLGRIRQRDEEAVSRLHSKHLTQTFVSGLLVCSALNEVKIPRFVVRKYLGDKRTRRPRSGALLLFRAALRARNALLPKCSGLAGLVTVGQSLHEQLVALRTQTLLFDLEEGRAHCLRVAKVLGRKGCLMFRLVILKILLAAKSEFGVFSRTFSSGSVAHSSFLFILLGGWLKILAFSL